MDSVLVATSRQLNMFIGISAFLLHFACFLCFFLVHYIFIVMF